MPDALNYREGHHPGCSCMCLTCLTTEKDPRQESPLSAWMGGATEKDWPRRPSDCQLQDNWKKTDRAITPAEEEVSVPGQLAPRGSLQAKQLHYLHTQLSLGQSCHREKNILHLCVKGRFGRFWLFVTLWTVSCQASRSEGVSRQEYCSVLAYTACHTLLEHSISCCCSSQPPWVLGAARTPTTQAATPPLHLPEADPSPYWGRPKPSGAASGGSPSGRSTYTGGNETTIETQGQCG